MTSLTKLEEKLIKLDEELHSILDIVREFKKKRPESIEEELEEFRSLADRIRKNRILDDDTTVIIRRMRDRNYGLQ